MSRNLLRLLLPGILMVLAIHPHALGRGFVLEDFESGQVVLQSYSPTEDRDPNSWEVQSGETYPGSTYALRLYGNTWKSESIPPYPIESATVLQVAIFVEDVGEMQAFGIGDGTNVLLYTFAGTQLPTATQWEVTYQGAFPVGVWNLCLLPVGRDWRARYGYDPQITRLIYVNDRDQTTHGRTIFDEIIDVTEDLPVAPDVEIVQGRQDVRRIAPKLFRVGIQFHAQVYDPDSQAFTYAWDFGDSSFSSLPDPAHEFLVHSDHTYTVSLAVRDDTGLWGRDSAQVRVDPSGPEPLITMNFVGDVMLARRYDDPGGLIDTYGPEHIFIPTRSIYGDAADINVCNLECPLTDEGTPHPTKSYVFRGRPSNVAGLTYAGIDLVSLANNHIIDYGERGMEETQEVLDAARIRWSGAGANEYLAMQPAFWSERGVAIAFLGQCNRAGREYNQQPFLDAAASKPGFAYLTETNIAAAIDSVRALADLVVAQLHAGIEYQTEPGTLMPGGGGPASDGLDFPLDRQAAARAEPLLDAADPVGAAADVQFLTRPSLTDRQLRWRAVEEGADLVICHHPHVLQGFEAYQDVLIAHSLGNFAFDQTFAETFPSVVLHTGFDKAGFRSFTFRPVFVDDWIPRPATGRLGREILDRMADYSRELNTVVGVDPSTSEGTIYLDPESVVWSQSEPERSVALTAEDGWHVSPPIERAGAGTLSRILSIAGVSGDVEVRVGRELLWHGDFEEEGATLWNLNSSDEVYDSQVVHQGLRSLRLRRASSSSGTALTDLEGYPALENKTEYSLAGYMRTENARDALFAARFYRDRGTSLLGTYEIDDPVSGTSDWAYFAKNFQVPADARYFNVRCQMDRPASGEGFSWFEELRLVEWEAWQPATLPLEFPYPNNQRFIQIRAASPSASATVRWEERLAQPTPSALAEWDGGLPRDRGIRIESIRPNPLRDRASIEYLLAQAGRVRLEVFDLGGRRVGMMEASSVPAGRHRMEWDARGLPSGLYFCRIRSAGEDGLAKVIVLR